MNKKEIDFSQIENRHSQPIGWGHSTPCGFDRFSQTLLFPEVGLHPTNHQYEIRWWKKQILQEGEGLEIEFKESLKNIDREMVAFANAKGGRIYVEKLGTGNCKIPKNNIC